MIDPNLLSLIIRGAFALGTAKIEYSKLEARTKGVPAEQIPSILDAMFAEASQALDKTIDNMPEDPT
jgi:hypothetical protein